MPGAYLYTTGTTTSTGVGNGPQYSFSEWLSETPQWQQDMYVSIVDGKIKSKKSKKIKYDDKEII